MLLTVLKLFYASPDLTGYVLNHLGGSLAPEHLSLTYFSLLIPTHIVHTSQTKRSVVPCTDDLPSHLYILDLTLSHSYSGICNYYFLQRAWK